MSIETAGSSWRDRLDKLVKDAGLPHMADLEGALEIYNEVACDSVSVHTLKRYPIPYKLIGRSRRYVVDDIIAFARARFKVPVRIPPQRPRGRHKPIVGAATIDLA
jgi:hypothetical protein